MPRSRETHRSQLPIGVFDSGMGGLTVLRQLTQCLPQESFVYLGDTARLPYGTKSQETVIRYATQMTNLLLQRDIKLLVIACNTATTAALPYLREQFPQLPIVGVVEPGAKEAVATTRTGSVTVLATETTIASRVYQRTIQSLNADIEVRTQSCGLFVALAEEGWEEDDVTGLVVKKYLQPILDDFERCDCVVLGCTHFPLLLKPIGDHLQRSIAVVDSATATAKAVKSILEQRQWVNRTANPTSTFLVTDLPERFIRIGNRFLGTPIMPETVFLVDGDYHA